MEVRLSSHTAHSLSMRQLPQRTRLHLPHPAIHAVHTKLDTLAHICLHGSQHVVRPQRVQRRIRVVVLMTTHMGTYHPLRKRTLGLGMNPQSLISTLGPSKSTFHVTRCLSKPRIYFSTYPSKTWTSSKLSLIVLFNGKV